MDSGMYTEREVQCLKEGMGAVRSVLSGTDTEAKRRLLFYLDWYMDPPYPILAAYLGNLSEKHKPKALYLLQGAV